MRPEEVNNQGAPTGVPLPPTGGLDLGGIACSQANLHKSSLAVLAQNKWMEDKCKNTKAIGLIQEPYLLEKKVNGFSDNLNVLYRGSENRSCIIATKDINIHLLSQFSDRDHTAAIIKFEDWSVVVASIYMPYVRNRDPVSNQLQSLVSFCELKNLMLVVCSDTNSHHLVWGSTDINTRGNFLLDYVVSKNLHVCNVGNKPTFENVTRKEVLDVTFASGNIFDKITNWKVSDDYNFSDHRTIEFNINFKADAVNTVYRNPRSTDWNKFKEEVQKNREKSRVNLGNYTDIDLMAAKLEQDIMKAFYNSSRKHRGKKFKRAPWWSAELTRSEIEVKRLKRRYDRVPTQDRLAEFRAAKNEHTAKVDNAKVKGWQKLVSEVDKLDTAARIQRVFKLGKKVQIGTVKNRAGEYTTSAEETLDVLLDVHFPEVDEDTVEEPLLLEGNNYSDSEINEIVNIEAVRAAIKSFKPFKAPGLDGISPAFLQRALSIIENDILILYRECLRQGKSPRRWLETKVVFIPKMGKADYTDPTSLRPISLFSFLLKGLERILHWHMNAKCLRKNLSKDLFAYKESVSTDDAIHHLVSMVEKTFDQQEICIVLFMDMSAAFSTANINGMVNNLKQLGVDEGMIKWAQHMLNNRTVVVCVNGTTRQKPAKRGTPQGGVGSPNYWNGNGHNLLKRFPVRHPTVRKAFADDIFNAGVGIDAQVIADNIQKDIKIMEKWASDHGLKFNTKKTKLMMFTRKQNIRKPDIFMYGEKIEYVSEFKYLGVTLQENLCWHQHVVNTARKANFTMIQCKKMIGKTWGPSPKVNKWMYTALVRPIMAYGILAWVPSTEVEAHMKILTKVQRRACLAILNGMHTTPTTGMEVMLNLEPIKVYLQAQAINTYRRLLANGNWKPQEGEVFKPKNHSSVIRRLARGLETIHMPRDRMINTEFIQTKFSTSISSRAEMNRTIKKPKPAGVNTINCFTDGSRTGEISGCGFIIKGMNIHTQGFKNLGKYATVFQAEMFAIKDAADALIQREVKNKKIEFFVDNQAAIKALGNYAVRSKLTEQCKRQLNVLATSNEVTVHWIPGHSGHTGNMVADNLAKMGTRKEVRTDIPISEAVIKQEIIKWSRKKHQELWDQGTDARQTRMLLPKVNGKLWAHLRRVPRDKLNLVTQIYTGHCTLQSHLYNMKISNNPHCEQCCEEDAEETVEHYLCECPAFSRNRYHTLGRLVLNPEDLKHLKLKNILDFIKNTKRFE